MMKKLPLQLQIFIPFCMLIVLMGGILLLTTPYFLHNFSKEETYKTIESSQNQQALKHADESNMDMEVLAQDVRTVYHFNVNKEGQQLQNSKLTPKVVNEIYAVAKKQTSKQERYEIPVGNEKLYYVILKTNGKKGDIYHVSYMWDSYRKEIESTLFKQLLMVLIPIIMMAFIVAYFISKQLSKPLVVIEEQVRKIARKQWEEEITINRGDEIGSLAKSINEMKRQLQQRDSAQQTYLQHISHDLKTPVMVIRSYARAMEDGVFSKEQGIETIEKEAVRLENKIKELLLVTKLDYMTAKKKENVEFSLGEVVKEVASDFTLQNADIRWEVEIADVVMYGDKEQWRVVVENLVDNGLRYAREKMVLKVVKGNPTKLIIWNDGPLLEEETIPTLFLPFQKGKNGNFGLGLTIVKRIVELHDCTIEVRNENNGVCFEISIR